VDPSANHETGEAGSSDDTREELPKNTKPNRLPKGNRNKPKPKPIRKPVDDEE